ncbi:hypothetical protein ACHAWO_000579 [Cyclotella atomus]|uniref:Calmodulin-lysine N-methyltransferase n=1 Tax=Cyclotella atomus TaxID=382360 RepID=A0ABD3PI57_9STRA
MASNQAEIPWVDAWIRWERNSKNYDSHDTDDYVVSQDEEPLPPPTECHNFAYKILNDDITLKIEGFHSDSEQTWNSTGLTLWKSSHYLCQYLVDHCKEFMLPASESGIECVDDRQMKVLEVGSGLGRCGMLAHLLSKASGNDTKTVLTDGDTDTLKQLRHNVQNNIDNQDNFECKQLLWGKDNALQFLQKQSEETSKFDLILGSDLLYVTSVIQPLFKTIHELLKPNDGKFFMAHCCRRVGNDVTLDEVLTIAHEMGFMCTEELRNDDDIVLYSFRLLETA